MLGNISAGRDGVEVLAAAVVGVVVVSLVKAEVELLVGVAAVV